MNVNVVSIPKAIQFVEGNKLVKHDVVCMLCWVSAIWYVGKCPSRYLSTVRSTSASSSLLWHFFGVVSLKKKERKKKKRKFAQREARPN